MFKSAGPRDSGVVLGFAACYGAIGFLALLLSFVSIVSGTGSVPRGVIILIALQLIAAGLLRASGNIALTRPWISALICTAVLLPLLAMQVTLLREPYVALSRGSASPAMLATLMVSVVLLVAAVWVVATNWQEPDEAGLIFLPIGMTVPALIGMRSTILQRPALQMLAEVMILAAAATAIAWFFPQASRVFVPPVAVAIEFVVLWVTGHGPWFHETSGDIVRVLYSAMLAVTVVLVVAVPFAAMWIKHGAARAASPPNPARPAGERRPTRTKSVTPPRRARASIRR